MTNLTRVAVAAILAVTLAACGGDSDDTSDSSTGDVPACADFYAPGRPTADVVADSETEGLCERGPDDLLITGHMTWDCPDGRTVYQASDEWGWGFSDGVWQGSDVPEPYADCVLSGTDAQHP